jgi:hypothetical protein
MNKPPAHFMPPPPPMMGVPSFWTCPFCGAEFGQPVELQPWDGGPNFWFVRCLTCNGAGPEGNTVNDAINKWNTRIEAREIT